MQRDLDFGSRIGQDQQAKNPGADGSDFSSGSQSFWQDIYRDISRLNLSENKSGASNHDDKQSGCHRDENKDRGALDCGGDDNLYGSFSGRGHHKNDDGHKHGDKHGDGHKHGHGKHDHSGQEGAEETKPIEETKPAEETKPVQETKLVEEPKPIEETKPAEAGHENTEAGHENAEQKSPFDQLRESIHAIIESMRASLGDEMTNKFLQMFDQIINQMEQQANVSSSETTAPASSETHTESGSESHTNSGSESHADSGSEPHSDSGSESHSESDQVAENGQSTAPKGSMDQVLFQNDWGRRGIVQADIPFHGGEGWGDGKYGYPPTADVTNYSPWGVVSQQVGKTADPNATINVKDQHVYFHLKGGGWVEAANPSNTGYWEAEYRRDFAGNESWSNDPENAADGSYQFGAPSQGRVDHFGTGNTALKFDPAKYDGIFQSIDAKADRDNSGLVVNFGGDYQRDYGITQNEAGQTEANLRNPAAGANNWTPLTAEYQKLYFTTMSAEAFKNDPPPGIS